MKESNLQQSTKMFALHVKKEQDKCRKTETYLKSKYCHEHREK